MDHHSVSEGHLHVSRAVHDQRRAPYLRRALVIRKHVARGEDARRRATSRTLARDDVQAGHDRRNEHDASYLMVRPRAECQARVRGHRGHRVQAHLRRVFRRSRRRRSHLVAFVFFFIRGAHALADVRVGHPRSVQKSICVVRFPRLGRVPARGRGPDALPVQDYSFRIGASRVDAPVDDGFEVGVDVSHARASCGNAVAGVVVQHDVHV